MIQRAILLRLGRLRGLWIRELSIGLLAVALAASMRAQDAARADVDLPLPAGRRSALAGVDLLSWQHWWFYNRGRYVDWAREQRGDVDRPASAADRRRAVAWLFAQLRAAIRPDERSACLLALAKIGEDSAGRELVATLRSALSDKRQQVRETAALALGVSQRVDALPSLIALATQSSRGARLVDRSRVSARTRVFAVQALGLLAHHRDELVVKQRVFSVLRGLLHTERANRRGVRAAAVQAIGVFAPRVGSAGGGAVGGGIVSGGGLPGHQLLQKAALAELLAYADRPPGSNANRPARAQVPTSLASLLGPGDSAEHRRIRDLLLRRLTNRRMDTDLRRATVLALGSLAEATAGRPSGATLSAALRNDARRLGDRLRRVFSIIALGRIGGPANRDFLLEELRTAVDANLTSWVGISLGLLAHGELRRGKGVDAKIGKALRREFFEASSNDQRGALLIALGLSGDGRGFTRLREVVLQRRSSERLVGYGATASALLGRGLGLDRPLRVHRPFALAMRAEADAVLDLAGVRQRLDRLVGQKGAIGQDVFGLVDAYAQVRDRAPIVSVRKGQRVRRFAEASLLAVLHGVLLSDERNRWSRPYAEGANYAIEMPLVDTAPGILDLY